MEEETFNGLEALVKLEFKVQCFLEHFLLLPLNRLHQILLKTEEGSQTLQSVPSGRSHSPGVH